MVQMCPVVKWSGVFIGGLKTGQKIFLVDQMAFLIQVQHSKYLLAFESQCLLEVLGAPVQGVMPYGYRINKIVQGD